jgi:hypothetical protein
LVEEVPSKQMFDFTDQKLGRLQVTGKPFKIDGRWYWKCECDCGRTKDVLHAVLTQKSKVKSCGCFNRERFAAIGSAKKNPNSTSYQPAYSSWKAMVDRCTNPNSKDYANYGAAGIKVCERWLDYTLFVEDMGQPPADDMSVDRYPDRKGNYEPDNARWATRVQQGRNKSNNRWETCFGYKLTVAEWSEITLINKTTLIDRLDAGWTTEEAFTTPGRRHPENFRHPLEELRRRYGESNASDQSGS